MINKRGEGLPYIAGTETQLRSHDATLESRALRTKKGTKVWKHKQKKHSPSRDRALDGFWWDYWWGASLIRYLSGETAKKTHPRTGRSNGGRGRSSRTAVGTTAGAAAGASATDYSNNENPRTEFTTGHSRAPATSSTTSVTAPTTPPRRSGTGAARETRAREAKMYARRAERIVRCV